MTMIPGQPISVSNFRAMIVAWPTDTPPTGWLICDGSAISRTTYADLFAIIGTTYGAGDGSTTFNLPNLKGRVIVGKDSAQTEFDNLAETGGEKTHVLTIDEMPAHTHTAESQVGPAGGDGGTGKEQSGNTGSTGGGQAHNNLQPYMVLNFIIKT